MSNVTDRLDSLLSMYYSNSTTDGEKTNALSLFKKHCIKNNIDPDVYMNKRKRVNSNDSYNPFAQYTNINDIMNDIINDIFRGCSEDYFSMERNKQKNANMHRQQRAHEDRMHRERTYTNRKTKEWEAKSTVDIYWEASQIMLSTGKTANGDLVVYISSISKSKKTNNRDALQNFCCYPKSKKELDYMTKILETNKDAKFVVHTSEKIYYRDHYVVTKIWMVDDSAINKSIRVF